MAIGNNKGAAADIGRGGVHWPQRKGGQEAATKIGKGRMYLNGDMAAGGSEEITTEGWVRDHKVGM